MSFRAIFALPKIDHRPKSTKITDRRGALKLLLQRNARNIRKFAVYSSSSSTPRTRAKSVRRARRGGSDTRRCSGPTAAQLVQGINPLGADSGVVDDGVRGMDFA